VGRTTFYVFSRSGQAPDLAEKMETVSPLLVESLEPMERLHTA
jgi:hypothetical protein